MSPQMLILLRLTTNEHQFFAEKHNFPKNITQISDSLFVIEDDHDEAISGPCALVTQTSDHHNRLLPDTTFIINFVAFEDHRYVRSSRDQSHQPTRAH